VGLVMSRGESIRAAASASPSSNPYGKKDAN
jgi:hypothetical protein